MAVRRTLALLVSGALLPLVPGASARTPEPDTASAVPFAYTRDADGTVHRGRAPGVVDRRIRTDRPLDRAAVRDLTRAGRERAGLPFAEPPHADAPALTDVMPTPVGDFDGDGRRDVVETTVTVGSGLTTKLTARRGYDGRALWSVDLAGAAWAISARVGADGKPGVIVEVTSFVGGDDGAVAAGLVTTGFAAYGGAGQKLWSRDFVSPASDSPAAGVIGAIPILCGVYDALPGKADDVLLGLLSGGGALVAGQYGSQTQLLNGADGSLVPHPAPMVAPLDFTLPWPVPDLDGDKLGDVLSVNSSAAGDGSGHAVATKGTDGRVLWALPVVQADSSSGVVAVGDTNSDGIGELALSPSFWAEPDDENGLSFAVVSGKAGTVLWSAEGEYPLAIGDVDRDGRRDVGHVTFSGFDSDYWGLTFGAYTATGEPVHERSVRVDTYGYNGYMASLSFRLAGDVQGDGIADVGFHLSITPDGGKAIVRTGIVDPRTGRPVQTRGFGVPLFAAVDARGADLLDVIRPNRQQFVARAVAGSTGAELWRSTVRIQAPSFGTYAEGADLTGDRCAEVVLGLNDWENSTSALVVLDGRNGRLLWGTGYDGGEEVAAPRVTPGADRNRAC